MSKKYLGIARIFILSMFLFFPTIVYAEIFFQDGFESGVLINQQIWEWIAYSPNDPCYSDGQIVPTTEDRFSGAYSAKFTLPAGDMCTSMYSQFSRSVGQGGDIYFRFRLKYLANREWILGGGDKVAGFFGNSRAPGGEWILFTLERGYHDTTEIPVPNDPHMAQPLIYVAAANTNGWRPCNDPAGSYFCQNIDQGNPFYITVGQWYTVEIYVKVDAYGAGQLKLWIDGKQLIDINNIYTIRGDNNAGFYRFEMGGTLNQPDYVFPVDTVSYWDDIIISDTCNSCSQSYLQFSPATYDVSEAGTTATITVTRTASSAGAVTVGYATSNGTATAGSDYTATSGTLSWADGETASKKFTVSITDDAADENDETINLTLSNPNGAQISGTNLVVLTITDNDSTGGNGGNNSGSDTSASGGSGCGFVKDDGKGQGAKGDGLSFMLMLIIALAGIAIARKVKVRTAKARGKSLSFKTGLIGITVLFLFVTNTPANATIYFEDNFNIGDFSGYGAIDNTADGCYSAGQYFADATDFVDGPYSLRFDMDNYPVNQDPCSYISANFFTSPIPEGATVYIAFWTKFSANHYWDDDETNKHLEIRGNQTDTRLIFNIGRWEVGQLQELGLLPADLYTGVPHLTVMANGTGGWRPYNSPDGSSFVQNINMSTPVAMKNGLWHSVIIRMDVTFANDGTIEMWINGVKGIEFHGIRTQRNGIMYTGTYIGGTHNQPTYAADMDSSKYYDRYIVTDNWQDIVNGGYLSGGGNGDTPPPSDGSNQNTGSDTSASGGSGCGFVKDDGKGQGTKGEELSLMILLFLLLILLRLSKARYRRLFMRKLNIIFLAGIFVFLNANISLAAVNLPWNTTYNCPDWIQGQSVSTNCGDLQRFGDWTCDNGNGKEQITSAANYSGGAGGKGQRHWLGDGVNNVSGGLVLNLASPQSELWLRWYMRYEQSFQWNPLNNQKIVTIDPAQLVIGYNGFDGFRVWSYSSQQGYYSAAGEGWNGVMKNGSTDANGNKTSDGQWHLMEVHIKMDTNGSNGIAEVWIDGKKIINATNASLGGVALDEILIGNNGFAPTNGRCMAIDYDDIAISATGPIGPIGGGNQNSGGDTSSSGGSGCGFVKDDNGKGQKAKGEGLSLIIMLIIILAGIAIARRFSNRYSYNL